MRTAPHCTVDATVDQVAPVPPICRWSPGSTAPRDVETLDSAAGRPRSEGNRECGGRGRCQKGDHNVTGQLFAYIRGARAPGSYGPCAAVRATANAAPQEIDVRFDGIDYVNQKHGFFNLDYTLKLPSWAVGYTVKLALDQYNVDYKNNETRLKISAQWGMPWILIQPRPAPRGSQAMTGGNLTEFQAKELLWLMAVGGMWGKRVTAYIVVYAVSAGGFVVKVSNPVTLDCPFEPAYFGGFPGGKVAWARPLGQALLERKIPYEIDGCLLLNVDVKGVSVWFFHCSKKLVAPDNPNALQRGVNCITYLDAAVGTNLDDVMKLGGGDIAAAAGATIVKQGVLGPEMLAYFNDADRPAWQAQSFILWFDGPPDGHCVLIHQGRVCEYSRNAGEYRETPVQEWLKPYKTPRYLLSLARLP